MEVGKIFQIMSGIGLNDYSFTFLHQRFKSSVASEGWGGGLPVYKDWSAGQEF